MKTGMNTPHYVGFTGTFRLAGSMARLLAETRAIREPRGCPGITNYVSGVGGRIFAPTRYCP